MAIIILKLRPAKKQDEPDPGKPVPERFVCNMPIRLSNCFDLVGGAWVAPQPYDDSQTASDLLCDGVIGIVQTHKKLRLVNRMTGRVMRL